MASPVSLLRLDPFTESSSPDPRPAGGDRDPLEATGPTFGAILGLDPHDPDEGSVAVPWPPPEGLPAEHDPFVKDVPDDEVPHFLDVDAPPPRDWGITKERAVAGSLIVHLLFVLFILLLPAPKPDVRPLSEIPDPLGIVKMYTVDPTPPPIPVQFFPAPGPRAPKAGQRPRPSDLDRQAHGGDLKFPRAETPKSVADKGIQDLDQGPRSQKPETPASKTAGQANGAGAGRSAEEKRASGTSGAVRPLSGLPTGTLADLSPLAARGGLQSGGSSARAGDEGAGWEQEGGFVDSGPLSFDTKGYDWGPYAAEMIRKIKRNWEVPSLAYYGIKGKVTIRFFILKDGRIEEIRLLVPSQHPPYDNAALNAIRNSNPFRPLPPDLGSEREGVTITFLYNLRPEDLEH